MSRDKQHYAMHGVRSLPIIQTDYDQKAYGDFIADELNRFGIDVLALRKAGRLGKRAS